MFALDCEIFGMRSLLSLLQQWFSRLVVSLPEAGRRCTWQQRVAASRWSRCCWGPAPSWTWRTVPAADPSAVAGRGNCVGEEIRWQVSSVPSYSEAKWKATFVQIDSNWSFSSFFPWCCWNRHEWQVWFLSYFLNHPFPRSNEIAQWNMIDQSVLMHQGLKTWYLFKKKSVGVQSFWLKADIDGYVRILKSSTIDFKYLCHPVSSILWKYG